MTGGSSEGAILHAAQGLWVTAAGSAIGLAMHAVGYRLPAAGHASLRAHGARRWGAAKPAAPARGLWWSASSHSRRRWSEVLEGVSGDR